MSTKAIQGNLNDNKTNNDYSEEAFQFLRSVGKSSYEIQKCKLNRNMSLAGTSALGLTIGLAVDEIIQNINTGIISNRGLDYPTPLTEAVIMVPVAIGVVAVTGYLANTFIKNSRELKQQKEKVREEQGKVSQEALEYIVSDEQNLVDLYDAYLNGPKKIESCMMRETHPDQKIYHKVNKRKMRKQKKESLQAIAFLEELIDQKKISR